MSESPETIGVLTRFSLWMFGSKSQAELTDAELGVQRLSALSVWVPIVLCGVAIAVLLTGLVSNSNGGLAVVRLLTLGTAALAVGCFFGLLFGTPRVNDGTPGSSENATDGAAVNASPLAANNNFYKIADWVTSAIVGIALVELKSFAGWFWRALQHVVGADQTLHIAITAGVMVALFFAGFIWTFLNARVILMKAFASADQSARETMKLRDRVDLLQREASDVVEQFQRLWNSDPNKGAFGGAPSRNGRTVSVTNATEDSAKRTLTVELTVSGDPGADPLTSPVIFFLHPTSVPQRETVTPVNGVARLRVGVAEAYTIGVTCDEGATQLELDLETAPEIPARYKAGAGSTKEGTGRV